MTNRVKTDTGAARLPALQKVSISDPALSRWVDAVTERLQVREGERGNDNERTVTLRELRALTGDVTNVTKILTEEKKPGEGETVLDLGGGLSATIQIDRFAQSIIDSRLFKSLSKTLDDPTRFDHLAQEIRDELLRSIADEAAKRGAEIRSLDTVVQNNERSLATSVREVTASLRQASAGMRAMEAAFSDGQRALATNVLQLQASLGNYYQDGKPGRASLEQEMTVIAGHTEGLRAQYTLKVQAGGALAGFGIAAEEVNGKTSSAFIIMADKFAVVSPNYSGGMMTTPRSQDVVFGVDADGIYLQRNVYLRGNMRIDGTGREIKDGMRGSVLLAASGSAWSDAPARQAVWAFLGNGGSAPNNNHLLVGDAVTITNNGGFTQTRHWMGTAWAIPAVAINGDLLVDGSVVARKVDTRGLTVRDNAGNVILDANGLDAQWLRNLRASQVSGLGGLALQDRARIGSTVAFPDGSVMNTNDFINRLQRITSNNIGVFMDTAAIGTAYIGQAAVGTLQIAGGAVTSMSQGAGGGSIPGGGSTVVAACYINVAQGATGVVVSGSVSVYAPSGNSAAYMRLRRRGGGQVGFTWISIQDGWWSSMSVSGYDAYPPPGLLVYEMVIESPTSGPGANRPVDSQFASITATGGNR